MTEETPAEALRRLAEANNPIRTHWESCWKSHWQCCAMLVVDLLEEEA